MRISRISQKFGADNEFFEYLVLQFYDFKLLVSLTTKNKIIKSHFLTPDWVLFIFWGPVKIHCWKLTIDRETIPNNDIMEIH